MISHTEHARKVINADIGRLERLVSDLRGIRDGRVPSRELLARAPVITAWTLDQRSALCFNGYFSGHPTIRDGHYGATSEIWYCDPSFRFARTLSRFYRLGSPGNMSEESE